MKKITAYQLSDGQIMLDETDAIEAENKLKIYNLLEQIVLEDYYRGMDSDDIINLIINNKDEIKSILDKN